jgi:hypothetical protein
MMSRDSISNRVSFRWICPLCTLTAYAILSLLPIGAAAQVPVLTPGLHNLTLPRADEPAIHYAITIPGNYSPSTPGFGARRLEQPRKREGRERIAGHGHGPILN